MAQLQTEGGVRLGRARSTTTAAWRRASSAERLVLSLRVHGLASSVRRAWTHFFGTEDRCVFVQYYKPPSAPVELSVEANGLIVRHMTESDRRDAWVRRHEPHDIDRLAEAFVATRREHIVGAAWYTDSVTPDQPWYRAVEPHLVLPAWLDANIFVVPGDKGAAWAIAKTAADCLGAAGIRSTVALVAVHNKRSLLLLRLLGAKMVARASVRHWFGQTTAVVEPVVQDLDNAVTTAPRAAGRSTDA
jgi:hypothetical protein